MTTIAWDGKVLAADRAGWTGAMKYQVRKVSYIKHREHGEILVAVCGDAGFCAAVMDWLKGGAQPGAYPEAGRTYTVALVVKRRPRSVWRIDSNLRWHQCEGRLQACGGGQEMALGAMAAGASARRAIEITMRHSDLAGFGVDVVQF